MHKVLFSQRFLQHKEILFWDFTLILIPAKQEPDFKSITKYKLYILNMEHDIYALFWETYVVYSNWVEWSR